MDGRNSVVSLCPHYGNLVNWAPRWDLCVFVVELKELGLCSPVALALSGARGLPAGRKSVTVSN